MEIDREEIRLHDRAMTMLKRKGLAFTAALGVEVERAERYRRPLTLLVFHIGRAERAHKGAWDDQRRRLFSVMTDCAVETLRAPDFCAPAPGGHFAVCLPETDRDGATQAAEKLRRAIMAREVDRRLIGPAISRVSWAATERADGEADPHAFLKRAIDAALAAGELAEIDAIAEPSARKV